MADEPQPHEPGTNGSISELDLPDLHKLKEQEKKRKGLFGVPPGGAGAASAELARGGVGGLIKGIMASKVASLAVTVGIIGTTTVVIPAVMNSGKGAAAKKAEARKAVGELPSDAYAKRQMDNSGGSGLSRLASVSQGSGMSFDEDAIAAGDMPNTPDGPDGAAAGGDPAAGAAAGAAQAAKDAAAEAKAPEAAEQMKRKLGESAFADKGSKLGAFGSGGGGGMGSFGGGGAAGSSAAAPSYGARASFGKNSFDKGGKGGKVAAMAQGARADYNNLTRKPSGRSSKGLAQLKMAARLSRQGMGAKSDAQAAQYATSAVEQQQISGGELIGGGAGIGGVGLQQGTVDPSKVGQGQGQSGGGGGGMNDDCLQRADQIKCSGETVLDMQTCTCVAANAKDMTPWQDKLQLAQMLLMGTMAMLSLVGLFADLAGTWEKTIYGSAVAAGFWSAATAVLAALGAAIIAAGAAIAIALSSGAPKDQTTPLVLTGGVIIAGATTALILGHTNGATAKTVMTTMTATGIVAGLAQMLGGMLAKPS